VCTKVRHALRLYIQSKSDTQGLKPLVLCFVSGFAYNFGIYTGQEISASQLTSEPFIGASSNVMVRLTRVVSKNVNHNIYFDNYSSSIPVLT
jgi:hypothetical protein